MKELGEMLKYIAVIVIAVLLIFAVTVVFLRRYKRNSYERKVKSNKELQPQPKSDDSDASREESTVLLQQIADLEKEKMIVQEGLLYQKELASIMEAMQYLVGISEFLKNGGKLNYQQESDFFRYNIVKQCSYAVDDKSSYERKRESLKVAEKNQYSGKNKEELQKIIKQLKREVSDKKITLSCRAVMIELNDKKIIESLALQEQEKETDWNEIQKIGESVKKIFFDNEIFFWFYGDSEVKMYNLQSEFNEGNSIAIDIPAVFVKDGQTDSVKLLGGYIGVYTDSDYIPKKQGGN